MPFGKMTLCVADPEAHFDVVFAGIQRGPGQVEIQVAHAFFDADSLGVHRLRLEIDVPKSLLELPAIEVGPLKIVLLGACLFENHPSAESDQHDRPIAVDHLAKIKVIPAKVIAEK